MASLIQSKKFIIEKKTCLPIYQIVLYLQNPLLIKQSTKREVVYGVEHHFQLYLSYIVAVSFIGGGNQRTQRKQPPCFKSLTNYMT